MMGSLIARWKGITDGQRWTAMLSSETYGPHFSVHGWTETDAGRTPSDKECAAAQIGYRHGMWAQGQQMQEVTSALRVLGLARNPWARQFVPADQAQRLYARASEAAS